MPKYEAKFLARTSRPVPARPNRLEMHAPQALEVGPSEDHAPQAVNCCTASLRISIHVQGAEGRH